MNNDDTQEDAVHPLFAELGLEEMTPEEQAETLTSVGEVVFQGVMLRVMRVLSEEKQDALSALFDASTEDPDSEEKRAAIYAFITHEVPQYDDLVEEELDALYETYSGNLEELSAISEAVGTADAAVRPDEQV